MFTTGSKFLLGASVVSVLAAVIYGVTQDGVLGTVGLVSAAVAIITLTTANLLLRDSNVFVDDESPAESTSAAQGAPGNSAWPLMFAFGSVSVVVGLVSFQPFVVVGLIIVLTAGIEWMLAAWAERASASSDHNALVRSRVSNPIEYPIGGAVAIGIVVYGFSRVMLWLSKTNTIIAFSVVAAVVLAIAFLIASRPSLKPGAVGGVMAVGATGIIIAGTAAGIDGERDVPEFETTSIWQEEALLHPDEYAEGAEEGEHPAEPICQSGEEFPEADERASETVALKSNAIEVFLRSDGTLEYNTPGFVPDDLDDLVTIPRSNITNVIFRNQTDDHARLSLDMGTMVVEAEREGGFEDEVVRNQICTTLIEGGGAQLLTVEIDAPSFAYPDVNPFGDAPGFAFFVPGIESATLAVVVP